MPEFDSASFDIAAEQAKAKLEADLQTAPADVRKGMIYMLKWFSSWYMTAGHKRLGRICVDLAKKNPS